MRINLKRYTILLTLVWVEWVKLESPEMLLEQTPSKAWINYQQERMSHNTKIGTHISSNSSKHDGALKSNIAVTQNFINGKIELPTRIKPILSNEEKQPISRSSLNGFVYFLKSLQGKLIRKGKRTIMEKINILKFLKNKIIKNIGKYLY